MLEMLAKADSFVLVVMSDNEGCAQTAVASDDSVAIVKMLEETTKQLLDQTLKSGNVPVILSMIKMMHEESKKSKEEREKIIGG